MDKPKVVLPLSPVRDITALIFVLSVLPAAASCAVLCVYVLSDTGSRAVGRLLSRSIAHEGSDPAAPAAVATPPPPPHAPLRASALLPLALNFVMALAAFCIFPRRFNAYLILFAKTIIASDLIGSSSVTASTVTSVTTITAAGVTTTTTTTTSSSSGSVPPLPPPPPPPQQPTPNTPSSAVQKPQSSPPPPPPSHESVLRSNKLVNAALCFVTVLNINYFIREWLVVSDYGLPWGAVALQYASVRSRASLVVDYVHLLLSIHVIVVNLSPSLKKYFVVAQAPVTLDSLSSISPNVPLFRLLTPPGGASGAAVTNAMVAVNVEADEGIVEVNVDEENPLCVYGGSSGRSVAATNFEIFCTRLTGAKPVGCNTPRLFESKRRRPAPEPTGRSRSSTTNSTTIVNETVTSIVATQPLWSLIAATKTMLVAPAYFSGKTTTHKNNGAQFVTTPHSSYIALSAVCIGDTKAVFRIIDADKVDVGALSVRLNDVEWLHKRYYRAGDSAYYICVYGLTPLFQYELEVVAQHQVLSHCIFNTISATTSSVLNQSPETTTSLLTLQSSLVSTIDKLHESKSKLKKLKRDENRRHAELKREAENLRGKLSKYNTKQSAETRSSGKLKGLKHSVLQLETEIEELRQRVHGAESQQSDAEAAFEREETALRHQIATLTRQNEEHEAALGRLKHELRAYEAECGQLQAKHERLAAKRDARVDEVNKVRLEIKNTKKNELAAKSAKRNKKYQERYEVVLPNLSRATAALQKELEALLEGQC
ncbi:Uncharacterized protein ABC855_g697 [[Candida] zeylanoides]